MANLLIGSSNVARFYDVSKFKSHREYVMVKCTTMKAFEAHMENVSNINKSVLISVFENFVADHVGNKVEELEKRVDECARAYIRVISATANRMPETKFGIVLPLGRPALTWYHTRVVEIGDFLREGLKQVGGYNVGWLECIAPDQQVFEQDQVHLTLTSGKLFVEDILDQAEQFFSDGPSGADGAMKLENRLLKMERQLSAQESINFENNLTLARLREEVDTMANIKKEDRLVITGLKSGKPLPSENRQKIEALKTITNGIFEMLVPGFKGKISFINIGKSQSHAMPMIEVKLDSIENAATIRKAFAAKRAKKELSDEWSSLFITNCVNLATRIRIDILKAIARKITNKKELAYVSGFISRPMMHVKEASAATNSRPIRSFSFVDAVSKFGRQMHFEDLDAAYSRTGNAFQGQVAQNFVIMNNQDHDLFRSGHSGSGYKPGADKGSQPGGSGSGTGSGKGRGGTKRTGENLPGYKEKYMKK
jgi:uncharacterized coiled-coil protein SlyX